MVNKHIFVPFVCALVSLCARRTDAAGFIWVNPSTHQFVDDDGNQRLFHGVDVAVKGPPYLPRVDAFDHVFSFSTDDYDYLQEWGLNAVRLAVMWPGVEPTRGAYNQTYIDICEKIVADLAARDIYTIVEMHQDVFSEKFCGEGVPDWAAIPSEFALPFALPIDKIYPKEKGTDYPNSTYCNRKGFGDYYFTAEASTAFQNFYDNKHGLADSFASYWQKLATVFSKYDHVLGYEIINEPWSGDYITDPDLLIPGVADRKNLAPLYERVNTAIRKVDQKHIVFFEPTTWDDFGVGFEQVPGGIEYANRSSLAYHIYIPPDISIREAFAARTNDFRRLGTAGFMTEFDLDAASQNFTSAVETANEADGLLQSWTGWEYKEFVGKTGYNYGFFYPNGSLNTPLVKVISRTYAKSVSGIIQQMSFDEQTSVFKLTYVTNAKYKIPTQIYLNEKFRYPNGYTVSLNPQNVANWTASHNHVSILSHFEARELDVVITPK